MKNSLNYQARSPLPSQPQQSAPSKVGGNSELGDTAWEGDVSHADCFQNELLFLIFLNKRYEEDSCRTDTKIG